MNIGRKLVLLSVAAAICIAVIPAGSGSLTAAAEDDYYAPVTETEGTALLGQLHDLITATHTYYSTYADCRDRAPVTDPPLSGETGVMEFYTHETITTYIGSSNHVGRWNREHVWCKSLSNGLWKSISNSEGGGGGDLHHIRPSEMSLNSTRGDMKYGEAPNGTAAYSKNESGERSQLGGHYAGGAFEPMDNVKGDVARIIFYVYTHYNTYTNVSGTTNGASNPFNYFGTLKFTHVMAVSSEEAAVEMLLEWNRLDRVDEIELARNEAVYGIQGNRNPFIDHPEYADMVWGDGATEPPAGSDEPAAFRAAVQGIVTEGTLDVRRTSLETAIAAYRALTDAQKQAAAEEAETMRAAIAAYNEAAASCNEAAGRAECEALKGAGGLSDQG